MIKVLYLSYDGLTDPLGQSQILPYLSGLSKEYSITIVSFEKKNRYEVDRELIEGVCRSNSIQWVPLVYHKDPPVISTLYDLWRLRRVSKMLHLSEEFKIIHCRSYLTALVGSWMKDRYNVKFLFDMRGFWADERVEGGLWNQSNIIYKWIFRFFKKKENLFLQKADATITLTKNAKEEMKKWGFDTNIYVIPCCVDLEHFNPQKINQTDVIRLKNELGISEDHFVLLYLGSLGTWYLTDEMMKFFEDFRSKIKTKFLLITLDDFLSTDNDIVVRKASRQQVPLYISMADASVMYIKNSFSKKASSATKMAEVLAMGVPVITNEGWGDISSYSKFLTGLIVVSDTPVDAIASAINAVERNKIREGVAEYFSLSKGIEDYAQIYRILTS